MFRCSSYCMPKALNRSDTAIVAIQSLLAGRVHGWIGMHCVPIPRSPCRVHGLRELVRKAPDCG